MRPLLVLLLLAPCTLLAQLPDNVPDNGLIIWYSMDGSGSNALSSQFNLNLGNISFGSDRFGNPESALWLTTDDQMATTSISEFPASEFSVAIWCKLETPFTYGAYSWVEYGQQLIGQSGSSGWNVGIDSANLYAHYFYTSQDAGGCANASGPISPADAGEWHHLVAVHDGISNKFYFNGTLVESVACNGSSNFNFVNNELRIGNRDNASPGAQRLVDEFGLWNRALDSAEVVGLYYGTPPEYGCTDTAACNFDTVANSDDGSCEYGCLYCGEGTVWDSTLAQCISIADTVFIEPEACAPSCGEGTVWDPVNEACIIAVPTDSDFDGCVTPSDLLNLLATFGTCPPIPEWPDEPVDTAWTCGDPIAHDGHEYSTTQIGDQCWFAENVRVLPSVWPSSATSSTDPRAYVYGYEGESLAAAAGQETYQLYGALYNYPARQQWPLCPSQWSVPTDEDWFELESYLGIEAPDLDVIGLRGTDQGTELKSTTGWNSGGAGTNLHGFMGLPGGELVEGQGFIHAGFYGFWGTSSLNSELDKSWFRELLHNRSEIYRHRGDLETAMSVRCIQD